MKPQDCQRIAAYWRRVLVPRGWRISYRRDGQLAPAWACGKKRRALIPKPDTPLALLYAIHEFCHVALKHERPQARWEREFEAEKLALCLLQISGVPVSREMLRHARENVAGYVKPRHRVPAHVRRWVFTNRR